MHLKFRQSMQLLKEYLFIYIITSLSYHYRLLHNVSSLFPVLFFFTIYSSMVNNRHYQKSESTVVSSTHISSHSHISNINALGEQQYEDMDYNDNSLWDYNHLKRPFPPIPTGRRATYTVESFREFCSMNRVASPVDSEVSREMMNQGTEPGEMAIQQDMRSPAMYTPFPSKRISPRYDVHPSYRDMEQRIFGHDDQSLTTDLHSSSNNRPTFPDSTSSVTFEERAIIPQWINVIKKGNSHERFITPVQTTLSLESANCNGITPGRSEYILMAGDSSPKPLYPTQFSAHNYENITVHPERNTSTNSETMPKSQTPIPKPMDLHREKIAGIHPETEVNPTTSKITPRSRSLVPILRCICGGRTAGMHCETELNLSFKNRINGCNQLTIPNSGNQDSQKLSLTYPNTSLASGCLSSDLHSLQKEGNKREQMHKAFLNGIFTISGVDKVTTEGVEMSLITASRADRNAKTSMKGRERRTYIRDLEQVHTI